MKKWIKAFLSGLVTVALTVGMLAYLTRLTEQKDSYSKYRDFYAQDMDFDVLFFGTSHVVNGILPMELWSEYGIVSYNCGIVGAHLPAIYWAIKGSLEYTTPQLVVIDCYRIAYIDEKGFDKVGQAHTFFDSAPFGENKLKAIWDVLGPDEDRETFLWDFMTYHERWSSLTRNDYEPVMNRCMGSDYSPRVVPGAEVTVGEEKLSGETAGIRYLRKAIDLCQERGIEVLLTYLPFTPAETNQQEINRLYDIAEEYGVGYIDYFSLALVDYQTDFIDAGVGNTHLNPSGARKVTGYLGEYIMEHYAIADRRNDLRYADWHTHYEDYKQFKIETLSAQNDCKSFLMLLQDRSFSACVFLSPDALWHSGVYQALLDNMGVSDACLSPAVPMLAVVDHISGETVYLAQGQTADTAFGRVTLSWTDGAYSILLDGSSALTLEPQAVAGAVVIDNAAGTVAATGQYAVSDMSVNRIQ